MKILIPVDRSPRDRHVVSYTARIAKRLKPTLAIVHIVPTVRSFLPRAVREGEAYAEGVAQGLREEGFASEAFFGKGDPAPLILELAKDLPADLIAMATHGRRGVGKLVLGSVADIVVSLSTIPVLLLRVPTAENGQLEESQQRGARAA